jgi:hypothetical protein
MAHLRSPELRVNKPRMMLITPSAANVTDIGNQRFGAGLGGSGNHPMSAPNSQTTVRTPSHVPMKTIFAIRGALNPIRYKLICVTEITRGDLDNSSSVVASSALST